MSEFIYPPSSEYHGPVTAISSDTLGFDFDDHCASCGSTDVRVTRPKNSELTATLRCPRCGRVTNIRKAERYPTARYSVLVNGRIVKESVSRITAESALTRVFIDMKRQSAEKTRQYYGRNYDSVADSIPNHNLLERSFGMIDTVIAFNGGYVDGLEIGEEYNLPDFPVSIVRVEDAQAKPTPKSRKGGHSGVDVEQLARDMDYAFWETEPIEYIDQFDEYPSEKGYLMSRDSLDYIEGVDDAIQYVETEIDPDEFPMYDDLLARLKARRKELAGPVSSKSRKPARKAAKPRTKKKPLRRK